MRTLPLLLLPAVLLVGCDGREGNVKQAVRASLSDPDSAKFGRITFNSRKDLACVTVNAKNKFGGYVGDEVFFMAALKTGEWSRQSTVNTSHDGCVTIINKIPDVNNGI